MWPTSRVQACRGRQAGTHAGRQAGSKRECAARNEKQTKHSDRQGTEERNTSRNKEQRRHTDKTGLGEHEVRVVVALTHTEAPLNGDDDE